MSRISEAVIVSAPSRVVGVDSMLVLEAIGAVPTRHPTWPAGVDPAGIGVQRFVRHVVSVSLDSPTAIAENRPHRMSSTSQTPAVAIIDNAPEFNR